ncbi:MAG TPA: photosynthetic reaction center cytochrome c subunit family protein [Bryobacteraceae bacterium]|jgi:hypothetical protein
MRQIVALALFSASLAAAAAPNISGVWKADLEKSKFMGPPPTNYLVIIEQKMAVFNRHTKEEAPQMVETTGVWTEHGQERSVLTVFDNGKPIVLPYQGVPHELTASSEGNTLTVSGEMAGRPSTFKRSYELSADGQTLTLHTVSSNDGKERESTIVLQKQPDSAGEPLRKPEELAETRFKNVKTSLKTLPQSDFIDTMHYFSWSLGKNCEFCHVAHKFDLDDKKEKKTARKMIEMATAIDRDHFDGHPAVRCFTCHEGNYRPLSHPLFPDEVAAEKERAAAQQAEQHK